MLALFHEVPIGGRFEYRGQAFQRINVAEAVSDAGGPDNPQWFPSCENVELASPAENQPAEKPEE